MTHFTPISALIGGLLIGLGTLLLLLLNGRIAGVAGILGGSLRASRGELGWRIAFLAGLALAPLAWRLLGTGSGSVTITAAPAVIILGGVLTGFGTRLGNGCTSGHGVCGIARLSRRSIAATLLFMLAAGGTVFVTRHLVGG
jgi:uncharacterized protein